MAFAKEEEPSDVPVILFLVPDALGALGGLESACIRLTTRHHHEEQGDEIEEFQHGRGQIVLVVFD